MVSLKCRLFCLSVYTAIQGIIDATNEQLKEIEKDCAENNSVSSLKRSNVTSADDFTLFQEHFASKTGSEMEDEEEVASDDLMKLDDEASEEAKPTEPTEHDIEIEKRLSHLREAMHIRSVENIENSDLKSIFLEGELPHDPQILVSATETETKTERMSNYAKDVADDEAVILSGKMTISLISLTNNEEDKNGITEDHSTTNNVA
jgi:hypothetical protein